MTVHEFVLRSSIGTITASRVVLRSRSIGAERATGRDATFRLRNGFRLGVYPGIPALLAPGAGGFYMEARWETRFAFLFLRPSFFRMLLR